jgi:hypothetical protein
MTWARIARTWARHPDNAAILTTIVMFALSVPVAFFTAWAFALWAAIPLLTRVVRWRMARGQPATAVADAERACLGAPGGGALDGPPGHD